MSEINVDVQTGLKTVVPFTPQQQAEFEAKREAYERDVLPGILLEQLRVERNQLLAETDYLALADSTLTDEMRDYRQALRDLPANTVDPANPVWPVKPGGNS
jgi:hypothetical protein